MRTVSKYFGAYLLGILGALILTPASIMLAGTFLVPVYVIGAVPGYVVWFIFVFTEQSFLGLLSIVALAPIYGEWRLRRAAGDEEAFLKLVAWRPMWFCFPIGFLGTFGIFFASVSSI